ncbi:hypothetical protein PIB30_007950 [Stylosanthes scabra]|uniref:Uncharacterized protein n=1 Tax=Stylosanthes scabra TaxID=79078 RepID=A0ABU6T4K9_9FABA|nr:hypothetical protein [Stylosanthes scabra]
MAYGKPLVATIFIVVTMLSVMSFNSEARRLLYTTEEDDMDSNVLYSSPYQTLESQLNMYYPNSILIPIDSATMDATTEISNGESHHFHTHLPRHHHPRRHPHPHPHEDQPKEKYGSHHHHNIQHVPEGKAPHLYPNVFTP